MAVIRSSNAQEAEDLGYIVSATDQAEGHGQIVVRLPGGESFEASAEKDRIFSDFRPFEDHQIAMKRKALGLFAAKEAKHSVSPDGRRYQARKHLLRQAADCGCNINGWPSTWVAAAGVTEVAFLVVPPGHDLRAIGLCGLKLVFRQDTDGGSLWETNDGRTMPSLSMSTLVGYKAYSTATAADADADRLTRALRAIHFANTDARESDLVEDLDDENATDGDWVIDG